MQIREFYRYIYDEFRKYRNRKQYKHLMRYNKLSPAKLNKEQKDQIKKLFSKYNSNKTNYLYHSWYTSINGTFSPYFIPDWLFYGKIENHFNDKRLYIAYSDKNIYDFFMPNTNFPITLIRNMGGKYYDINYKFINEEEVMMILSKENEFVIKPSIDSGGGNNVSLITDVSNLKNILNNYKKNYIIQKRLIQHDEFSKFNSSSVNIVRLISLRFDNKIQVIQSALRVGAPGSFTDNFIDKNGRSMLTIGVDEDGHLKKYAYFANGDRVNALLNNYEFFGTKIYCIQEMKELAVKLHEKFPYFNMISWDMTVDKEGRVVVMEYNLRSQGITYYQYVNGPLFGSLTEKIIDELES